MLKVVSESPKTWGIAPDVLIQYGLRAPQGFSLHLDLQTGKNHLYWTTNESAAFLFYKKFKEKSGQTLDYFEQQLSNDSYLYNLSFATESDIELSCPQGLEYRPHQKAGIEYILKTDNTLVADEQRTGKTPTVLGVINNLEGIEKILILCPKTAKFGWLAESKKWLIKKYKIQVLTSQSEVDESANIYICNYDILHVLPELQKIEFDLLVGDEVHLVKNQDARRSKFFFDLKAKKKIGLSGTPLLNTPADFLTVLKWLSPFWDTFSVSRGRFASSTGITLSLEEVQNVVRSNLMIRRLQSQVFDSEPIEKRIITLPVDEEIKSLIYQELNKLSDYAKVRRQIGIVKVRYALNHIDAYSGEGDKIVVFAHHREVIQRISSSLGAKAVTIYGETTDKERQRAVERFNNDPTCTVLVGSVAAASMALNLSVANHILFVECDWSNGLMAQAEERCSDKLQTKQVLIEYMCFEDSLDYYILNKVDIKNKVVDRAIDKIV